MRESPCAHLGLLFLLTLGWVGATFAEDIQRYEYLSDPTITSIELATSSTAWKSKTGTPALGFVESPSWIRLNVPATAEVLLLRNTWIPKFKLYLVEGSTVRAIYAAGTARELASGAIDYPQPAFKLPTSRSSQPLAAYILHEVPQSTASYPVQFFTDSDFQKNALGVHVRHGLIYGILFLVLLYNLGVYITARSPAYLYLAGYNLGVIGFLSGSDGFSQYYLWPGIPELPELVTRLSLGLAMVCLGQFALRFFNIGSKQKGWQRTIATAQIFVVITTFYSIFGTSSFSGLAQPLSLVVVAFLIVFLNVQRSSRGDSRAIVFLLANTAMALMAIANAAIALGIIPGSAASLEPSYFAAVLEVIILSLLGSERLGRVQRQAYLAKVRSRELATEVRHLQASSSMANEHREMQKSVQQAQKLKSIGQLTGGVAHDFNNILASILGFTELALDKFQHLSKGEQIRYLQEIQKAGQRGADLVKQLLIYSRNGNKTAKHTNLSDLVRQTIALLRGSIPSTVSINVDIPDDDLSCRSDPVLLQQTLVNLALNATEAMRERGALKVTLGERDVSEAVCSSCMQHFSGHFAVIKVEDSGPGLPDNVQDLFNPFYTSKAVGEGSGLGLSVVHGIVHEHYGHVQLSDRAPQGVRASVFIPTHSVSETVTAVTQRLLLVVEDDSMRSYLQELLASQGYDVIGKALPVQALELFVVDPHRFDLVLTDHLMSQQTGLDLAQEMRRLRPDLPVVLTSGNPQALGNDALKRSGIAAVFEKPIQANLLLSRIKGLLHS